jgi:hypothetical protein
MKLALGLKQPPQKSLTPWRGSKTSAITATELQKLNSQETTFCKGARNAYVIMESISNTSYDMGNL